MSENNVETVEAPVLSDHEDEVAELRRQLAEQNEKHEAEPGMTPPEREATGGHTRGTLAGREILVPPLNKWRSSAMRAINTGDFETWADVTLDDDEYAIWQEIDPTVEEINDFFETITAGIGASQGNSRASRRASNRATRN